MSTPPPAPDTGDEEREERVDEERGDEERGDEEREDVDATIPPEPPTRATWAEGRDTQEAPGLAPAGPEALRCASSLGSCSSSLRMPPAGEPIGRLVEVLVRATASLFPAWLPETEDIDDASEASVAAVRRLAARAAEKSALFGPVVQALAARSVGGHADLSSVPVETLVRECFKLVCRSYGTGRVHLVLDTEGDPADLPHLVGWLTALDTFDLLLVHRAAAAFPPDIDAAPAPIPDAVPVARGLVHLSAVEGRPSPTSETEKRIEARLRESPWAAGRVWNRRFVPGPLVAPIHPDLMFAGALLVVEFDGPDHLNRIKYAADRKRDRILQQCGFAVFHFTNDEVALDIERVIGEIAAEVARRIS